jgi:hypothetical protein
MKILLIQENGRHNENRHFRECFCLQRGFVCENENEYVESIVKLCNDKELYKIISYNAKNRALDFEEKK